MSTLFQSVPAGWHRTSLRYLAQGPQNGAWGSEAGEDEIDSVCVRVADFDWSRLTLKLDDPTTRSFKKQQFKNLRLLPGDIVIEKSGGGEKTPVGRVVSFDQHIDAVTSNFVARIRPHENVWNRYLLYLLAAHYMSGYSRQFIKQNTGIQNLDDTNLFRSEVWIPDLTTQRQISDFLDREAARIDLLIEKKQRLVQLLGERFGAAISRLTVPPHQQSEEWVERPIKALCSVFGRIGFRGYTTEDIVDEGAGAITLSPSNIKDGQMTLSDRTYLSWQKYKESPEIQISAGDIVFVKTGSTIGKVAKVDDLQEPMTLNPQLVVLKKITANADFLLFAMQSKEFQYQVSFNRFGGSTPAMSQGHLGRLKVWLPIDIGDQRKRAEEILRQRQNIEATKKSLNASIGRLQEYRSALITAAVTGQIDVTSWRRRGEVDRRLERLEAGAAE